MVAPDLAYFKRYFEENLDSIKERYADFLRFATVSSDPTSALQMDACAQWLMDRLRAIGCAVEEWRAGGPPIVFGSLPSPHHNAPTVLIYNHYDVQPADPLDEWQSNPFEARFEGDTVFARGAQDDKGHCLFVLLAAEALVKAGPLPCNLKFLIEGEEENGSAALIKLVDKKKKELSSDYTMVIDAGMRDPLIPAINVGTRGLISFTLTIKGTNQDLHSGAEGGLAYNPLHAMVSLLSSLRNPDGSIAVPHFYDEVVMPTKEELSRLALKFDEKEWEARLGQPPTGGEKAFPPIFRNWLRPTLEINGIHGGYGGAGVKTVIPKKAIAKITCRLVPDQDPLTIAKRVQEFLLSSAPPGVTVEVFIHEGMGKATRTSCNAKGIQAVKKALGIVWGKEPEYILDGASVPIIPLLKEASGGEIITWGVGLPTDHIHAPNERFDLKRMERGFTTLCLALEELKRSSLA